MSKLMRKMLLCISTAAFCGIVNAADTQATPAAGGAGTDRGARQDSAGGPNSGSDTAGDAGSKGTQSGQKPAAGGGPRQDTAGGANTGNDSAGDTGSQGTQSGQKPRQNPSEEFAAEMRKCESMSGSGKTSCETDAKKKHGQM